MNLTGMPQDVGFLTFLQQKIIQAFTFGLASVIPEAMALLGLLTGLEILLMGIWWLWSRQIDLGQLVAKVVGVNILGWFITSWQPLTKMVINTFIQYGLMTGGNTISQTDFTDPSNIARYGVNVAVVVNTHLSQPDYTGWGALWNIREITLSGLVGLGIAVLYLILAAWICVVLLEFYGTVTLSVVLVPWGVFKYTAFLAEKTFAWLCAAGIQVMGLAFVTSIVLPVMIALQGGMHPTLGDLLYQMGGVIFLGILAFRIHKFANNIISGHPQLTLNDAGQVVQTTVAHMNLITNTAVGIRNGAQNIASQAAHAASNLMGRRRI